MRRWTLTSASLGILAVLMVFGCNQQPAKPELNLVTVKGTVTLDGKPASEVAIWFVPETGTPGNGSFGITTADGSYSLSVIGGDAGVAPGQYTVTFSKFMMKDGSPVPWGIQPESIGAKQSIPEVYVDASTSDMKAIVTDAGGTFDFDLSSKPAATPKPNQ